MTWENEFDRTVLQVGKRLYQEGYYEQAKIEENKAEVYSETRNLVFHTIIIKNGGKYTYQCNCATGKMGRRCVHMAGLMYKWHGKDVRENSDTNIKLIDREEDDHLYFDTVKIIRGLKLRPRQIQTAKQYVEEKRIRVKNISFSCSRYMSEDDNEDMHILGAFQEYGRELAVELRMNQNDVQECYCQVCHSSYHRSFTYYNEICEHQLALLAAVDKIICKYNPGDATNHSGDVLIRSFNREKSKSRLEENVVKKENILIEPRIVIDRTGEKLAFKIGTNKMYALKNMSELVREYERDGSLTLGKSSIHFNFETFSEQAKKCYEYIERRVKEYNSVQTYLDVKYRYLHADIQLKNSVNFSGIALDEFYDLFLHQMISADNKTDEYFQNKIHIEARDISISMALSRMEKENKLIGLQLTGSTPLVLRGANYYYFLDEDALMRIDEDALSSLKPFIDASDDNGNFVIRIGESNYSEFIYRILPSIRKSPYIHLEEDSLEDVIHILPKELEANFYLDSHDEEVTCQFIAKYGEEELNIGNEDYQEMNYKERNQRDIIQENRIIDLIKEYFSSYNDEQQYYYQTKSDDVIFDLLDSGISRMMAYGDVHTTDSFNRLRIKRTPIIKVGVSVSNNLLDLEVVSQDLNEAELLDILNSYKRKKKYHRLKNGEFIVLEENASIETLVDMMETMNIPLEEFVKGKLHLPLYRALYVDKMLESREELVENRDKHFRNIIRDFSAIKDSEFEIPDEMKDRLRGYQKYGYKWLRTLSKVGFGGILADDMGLGKTIQVMSLLVGYKEEGILDKPALVVCPSSVVYNWEEEFHRFAPSLNVMPITGTAVGRKKLIHDAEKYDVLITSYDLLKRDIEAYKEKSFSFTIADEAQYIKNPKSLAAKTIKIINSENRFALTGTPIENRLSELWSIFDFVMPGFLYKYDLFKDNYEMFIVKDKDEKIAANLRKMVSPFILRRLKSDVLTDLPDKIEEVRYARFNAKQQNLYDAELVKMKNMIMASEDNGGDKIKILAELTRLRQICCDPELIIDGYDDISAKKESCVELIESAIEGGHRILLFSQFTSMLELLEKELKERNIPYYKITGSTSKEERMHLVRQFNDAKCEVPLFLISLKAGGTGLNLTGADVVIHYDPWWNLAAQNQATDRAHRIGQDKIVTVYKLIIKNTIEERILELQEAKKELADAIINGETTSLASLSKEELIELIS